MKWVNLFYISVLCLAVSASIAWGNPSMLPQHPGYQMHDAKDPVTGLPVANDPGQAPLPAARAIEEAAAYHDKESVQNTQEYMSLESQGAGVLPKTKGYPEYKIVPLVESIKPNN